MNAPVQCFQSELTYYAMAVSFMLKLFMKWHLWPFYKHIMIVNEVCIVVLSE
jgi:hypothetical protein